MTASTRKAKAPKVEEVTEAEAPAEEVITYSAKALAAELGIDQKSFRRWLRSYTKDRANKGGRWVFDAATRATLLEAYAQRNKGTQPTLPDADEE